MPSYSLVDRRMEGQTVKNNTRKSHKHSQIEVVTNWQHTDEASPAFKRLMMLLLEPSPQPNNGKAVNNENR